MDSYAFLNSAYDFIVEQNTEQLLCLLNVNRELAITVDDFISFTNRFSKEDKSLINGSFNLHGMGGSGLNKPNISSIATLYLSVLSEQPIVKTGSRKNTSLFGSTDFFSSIGITEKTDKKVLFHKFGFAYYDYLELSPWKAYKDILSINYNINAILKETHFFDYTIGTLGLGITSQSAYANFLSKRYNNMPNKIIPYYSLIETTQVDELLPTEAFIDNESISINPVMYKDFNLSLCEIQRINRDLVIGENTHKFWYEALRITVAAFLYKIDVVDNFCDGLSLFEKCYRDKLVKKRLDAIRHFI